MKIIASQIEVSLKKNLMFTLIEQNDIGHEEDCLRNAFTLKCWLRYIEHVKTASFQKRVFIYERAVLQLPGSFKLWRDYLELRTLPLYSGSFDAKTGVSNCKLTPDDNEWILVNNCFEKCLVYCHRFPVIWLMYLRVLMHQCNPTLTRRNFDRALKALPITQHTRIWALYLQFARNTGGVTAIRVYRRYLKLESDQAESYVNMLIEINPPKYAEAARCLASIVEIPTFKSKFQKSNHQLCNLLFNLGSELCDLICSHSEEMDMPISDNIAALNSSIGNEDRLGVVERLDVEKILRCGISKFTDQVGKLWVCNHSLYFYHELLIPGCSR